MSIREYQRLTPYATLLEESWGKPPGNLNSDGENLLIYGKHYGNVFVGVQPTFGYEGDTMRLLFYKSASPHHRFSTYYSFVEKTFGADAVLQFSTLGSLNSCPDSSNLTPPVESAVLYKGLKQQSELIPLIHPLKITGGDPQIVNSIIRTAKKCNLDKDVDLLQEGQEILAKDHDLVVGKVYSKIMETEPRLLPCGLHVIGEPTYSHGSNRGCLKLVLADNELGSLKQALEGKYVEPREPIRKPKILPTGKNVHALDPQAIPATAAMQSAKIAVDCLPEHQKADNGGNYPETVAPALWGTENLKTYGESLVQVLWITRVRPVADAFGRVNRVEPVSLEELGRQRIDVVVNYSGVFRDSFINQFLSLSLSFYLRSSLNRELALSNSLLAKLSLFASPNGYGVGVLLMPYAIGDGYSLLLKALASATAVPPGGEFAEKPWRPHRTTPCNQPRLLSQIPKGRAGTRLVSSLPPNISHCPPLQPLPHHFAPQKQRKNPKEDHPCCTIGSLTIVQRSPLLTTLSLLRCKSL
ncbi:hypothetical protein Nepgr_010008 [Nepenthes gracilis]|uniref:CobN/magnesium chelatase domain-containing protein n=1 Tax=Nepenthes gracilis TaxID=150966 RepID=A0AAD3SBN7_NEPGR|nr:hypothetical protein Nepgr_010008 [Nepenthes gracilis]